MSLGRTGKVVTGTVAVAALAAGAAAGAYASGLWTPGWAQASTRPGAATTTPTTPTKPATPGSTATTPAVTPSPATSPTAVPDRTTPAATPSRSAEPTRTAKPTTEPAPPVLMGLEARSDRVRNLEARLVQLGLLNKRWVDGYFGTSTRTAVRTFQKRHDLRVLGYVDATTWRKVLDRTRTPTRAELYPPKPKPRTGKLDSRCLTGRVICIDKSGRTLRWVVDGEVRLSMDARFGCRSTPTREGVFSVRAKVRDEYSNWYDSRMPFAMYFSGHQAVHYSDDFRARGYNGCSHGCVNIRDWNAISALFSQARVGDKVVVYRS